MWLLMHALEKSVLNMDLKWIFTMIKYFPICFTGSSYLFLCLDYTQHKFLLKKENIVILFFPSAFFYISMLTNKFHYLFFSIYNKEFSRGGLLFGLHSLVTYSYIALGTVLLISFTLKQFKNPKKQVVIIALAAFIPIIQTIINYYLGLYRLIDLTPISLCISLSLLYYITFRYKFMDIKPIALQRVFNNMSEAVIVVDNYSKVIDINSSFKDTFYQITALKLFSNINEFTDKLKDFIDPDNESKQIVNSIAYGNGVVKSGEISVIKPTGTEYYFVNIRSVSNGKDELLGKIISFNNISEYKRLLEEINEKNEELQCMNTNLSNVNEELTSANKQLELYASTVEELAIARERNRFAKDIHDTLGHTLSLLITILEGAHSAYETNDNSLGEKLSQAIKVSREGLKEVRRSLEGLSPKKLEAYSVINALKMLIEDFKCSGININFTVEGIDSYRSIEYSDAIYRTCQEALTNSLRHGKAKNVSIFLKFNGGWVKLYIVDDGKGCKKIKRGFGLTGMDQRIKNLNGNITFCSDGETGFNIYVEIPLEV